MIVVLPAGARAQHEGRGYGGARGKADWRYLTYNLPGAYALLDRLDLAEAQQKVLSEVYKRYMIEHRKAYAAVAKELPRMAAGDYKDAKKMKAYYARRDELLKKHKAAPPVEEVSDILTPDQLGKILEANQVIAGWEKWLLAHLAAYDKKLDELLGPVPEAEEGGYRYMAHYTYRVLDAYVRGAAALGGRLGLTEQQKAALAELEKGRYAQVTAMTGPLSPSLRSGKLKMDHAAAVRSAVNKEAWAKANEAHRQAVEKLLTKEQGDALAKGMKILEERDRAICERYAGYVEDLSKILPPRKKAGAPAAAVYPAPKKSEKTQ